MARRKTRRTTAPHDPTETLPKEAATGGTVTVYVRIPTSAKTKLERFATKTGESYADVLRRLVDYFNELPDDDARNLLNPEFQPFKLFLREFWIDHAYSKKRWPWAIELLHDLDAELVAEAGPTPVRLREAYRLGYAWLAYADVLRRQALGGLRRDRVMLWERRYGNAIRAMRVASTQFTRYLQEEPKHDRSTLPHPVISYNLASCSALLAAYEVEKALGPDTLRSCLHKSSAAPVKNSDPFPDPDVEKLWGKIGGEWRNDSTRVSQESLDEVGRLAREALRHLEQISAYQEAKQRPWTAASELVQKASEDADFAFLRHDASTRYLFEQWARGVGDDSDAVCEHLLALPGHATRSSPD